MPKRFLVLIGVLISISSFSQKERKTQLWDYNKISVPLGEKTSFGVVEKIHFTPKTSSVDLKFGDLWMTHQCNNWFEYAGGFRLSYARKNGEWLEERRPMLLTEVSKDIKNFDFSLSGRFEYRWFKEAGNHFRFRQKLNIDFPPILKNGLSFFTSEEAFIKMNSEKTHLARVYAGINTFDKKHFEMKIYYSLEKMKSFNTWDTTDIIGMNMSISL
jgi:hypothetical protein